MTKRILVPLDGSPQSWTAFEYALAEQTDAAITLLHVIDPVEGGYAVRPGSPLAGEKWYQDARGRATDLFEEAQETADADADLKTVIEVGRPATTIVEYGRTDEFDAVVMGSHGRSGVSRILLGSVAETVVRRSSIPVTVVR